MFTVWMQSWFGASTTTGSAGISGSGGMGVVNEAEDTRLGCRAALSIAAIVLLWLCGTASAEIYKWVDENGELHMATSLADVPERYRDQITRIETKAAAETKRPAANEAPSVELTATPPKLRRFQVPYENQGSTRRVIIPVTFNDTVTAPMALDTGSPGMVISLGLAVKLGIFTRDSGTLLTQVGGIGGGALAILTIVDSVSVQGARDTFIPTNVMPGISEDFAGLIGMDFLSNYTISIDTRNKVVVFQEIEPQPGTRGGHDEGWWRKTFEDFRAVRDGWKDYAKTVQQRPGSEAEKLVQFQVREAERLLLRLDLYASDNAVPRHWR